MIWLNYANQLQLIWLNIEKYLITTYSIHKNSHNLLIFNDMRIRKTIAFKFHLSFVWKIVFSAKSRL